MRVKYVYIFEDTKLFILEDLALLARTKKKMFVHFYPNTQLHKIDFFYIVDFQSFQKPDFVRGKFFENSNNACMTNFF